jgi:hypothetical protein
VDAPGAARAIAETRAWVERAVIGLNLCPYARAVQAKGLVRYVVSAAPDADGVLAALQAEMAALTAADPAELDTTILILTGALADFADYNDFLGPAEAALAAGGHEGVLQIASFHPRYRFAGSADDDLGNATNRSPWPLLHLLREASVDRAVAAFPEAEAIYERNIATLEALGAAGWAALQARCRQDAETGSDAA